MNFFPVTLTVCVIGRNESASIDRLVNSLEPLSGLPFGVETIYVDSASTDNSVSLARGLFDRVLVLDGSKNLCASAGRFIGTLEGSGSWVLYLDADMTLHPEFYAILARLENLVASHGGFVGGLRDVYPDGKVRDRLVGSGFRENRTVPYFGGAVLLRKEAVMVAGNWNPCLFSHEEIDLYSRMVAAGYPVRYTDTPMVDHFTERIPAWRTVTGNFVPSGVLGKKFYGFGQLLASRFGSGNLLSLLRYYPYPFLFFLGVSLAACFGGLGLWGAALLAAIATVVVVSIAKGPHFLVMYTGAFIQLLAGWRRFDPTFVPVVTARFERPPHAISNELEVAEK
ncbi:MAG: glycosyltransferase [Nitrospirota bacterium]|nr:glycosyltransferase [Nitrospirota bacterium]